MKIKKNRKRKFIELCAQGITPYRACIDAGYSEKYAKRHSHELSEKCQNEIEALKPAVQEVIKKEFNYGVKTSFDKLCEIQELALMPDEKGNYNNLMAAIKAEELKGRMYGVYEAEKQQSGLTINYIRNYE